MANGIDQTGGAELTVTIKDKVYKITPLIVDDVIAFAGYIKSRKVKQFIDASDGMGDEKQTKIIKEILAEGISEEELDSQAETVVGIHFFFYRVLRSNPGVTLESIGELLDKDEMAKLRPFIQALGGTESPPPPGAEVSPSTGTSVLPSSPDTTGSPIEKSES